MLQWRDQEVDRIKHFSTLPKDNSLLLREIYYLSYRCESDKASLSMEGHMKLRLKSFKNNITESATFLIIFEHNYCITFH